MVGMSRESVDISGAIVNFIEFLENLRIQNPENGVRRYLDSMKFELKNRNSMIDKFSERIANTNRSKLHS